MFAVLSGDMVLCRKPLILQLYLNLANVGSRVRLSMAPLPVLARGALPPGGEDGVWMGGGDPGGGRVDKGCQMLGWGRGR